VIYLTTEITNEEMKQAIGGLTVEAVKINTGKNQIIFILPDSSMAQYFRESNTLYINSKDGKTAQELFVY
jgi:hypothetical protein